MTDSMKRELAIEARKSLDGYLATGIVGFWQKAIDRAAALGFTVEKLDCCEAQARNLKIHLLAWVG